MSIICFICYLECLIKLHYRLLKVSWQRSLIEISPQICSCQWAGFYMTEFFLVIPKYQINQLVYNLVIYCNQVKWYQAKKARAMGTWKSNLCKWELKFQWLKHHLNFRYCACFEERVPWHSGNYSLWRVCGMIKTHCQIESYNNVGNFLSCIWTLVEFTEQNFGTALCGEFFPFKFLLSDRGNNLRKKQIAEWVEIIILTCLIQFFKTTFSNQN